MPRADSGQPELLIQIATVAASAIPGADGAGLTILKSGRTELSAGSSGFMAQIEELQYRLGDGPSVVAVALRRSVRSGAMGNDPRWPKFGPRAARLGLNSGLSLPMLKARDVIGVITLYAFGKDVFDDRSAELGRVFALPATISVVNAQVLARSQQFVAQLQTALTTRPVIDQAIGILRSRSGGTAEDAFDRLRAISQKENIKVSLVAGAIVDEAVARAQRR